MRALSVSQHVKPRWCATITAAQIQAWFVRHLVMWMKSACRAIAPRKIRTALLSVFSPNSVSQANVSSVQILAARYVVRRGRCVTRCRNDVRPNALMAKHSAGGNVAWMVLSAVQPWGVRQHVLPHSTVAMGFRALSAAKPKSFATMVSVRRIVAAGLSAMGHVVPRVRFARITSAWRHVRACAVVRKMSTAAQVHNSVCTKSACPKGIHARALMIARWMNFVSKVHRAALKLRITRMHA